MKTITVRLPDALVSDIEAESRSRRISKSDVIRRRSQGSRRSEASLTAAIADLIGSVDGMPSDLSSNKKSYLRATRYGQTRFR